MDDSVTRAIGMRRRQGTSDSFSGVYLILVNFVGLLQSFGFYPFDLGQMLLNRSDTLGHYRHDRAPQALCIIQGLALHSLGRLSNAIRHFDL